MMMTTVYRVNSEVLVQEPLIYDVAVNPAAQQWNWRRGLLR
jgi:hypothetical protein